MNRLTKFALAASAVFTVCSSPVFASSGIFGAGVVISTNIGGSPALDLFEMILLGDSRYSPNSSGGGYSLGQPTLINTNDGGGTSTWADGSNPSLGTFNVGTGDTLTLDGGEELTFKNGGSNVSATDMFYSINGGSFQDATLAFNQDSVNSTTGDQRWYSDSAADVNLLSGLSNGTYTLSIYFRDSSTDGTGYASNNGNNFNATFTVVPEPSTVMMLMSSSLFGTFYLLRRKRK